MQPVLHGHYTHYKDQAKQYEVIAIGYAENTLEKVVIYRALYDSPDFGHQPVFVRPLENFVETIEVGGLQVPRFSPVE